MVQEPARNSEYSKKGKPVCHSYLPSKAVELSLLLTRRTLKFSNSNIISILFGHKYATYKFKTVRSGACLQTQKLPYKDEQSVRYSLNSKFGMQDCFQMYSMAAEQHQKFYKNIQATKPPDLTKSLNEILGSFILSFRSGGKTWKLIRLREMGVVPTICSIPYFVLF